MAVAKKIAQLEQLIAYAQNVGSSSLERLVRELAEELQIKVDEERIKEARK